MNTQSPKSRFFQSKLQGKLLPLFAGALSLALSAVVIPAAMAQTTVSQEQGNRQELNRLDLTSEQQAQMDQIRQDVRSQIADVLTPDQKARVQEGRANGESPREIFESLDLSADQRSQLQDIRQSARSRAAEVLTPEQRQEVRQNRSERGQDDFLPAE
ncbi:MAG TPA: hypothetical protein V6D29_20795 [Leptolyngbyaceae cyanobacterium]